MFAMRAIHASRPVQGPVRHGAAGTAPHNDRAGFRAALKAAGETAGEAAITATDSLDAAPTKDAGRTALGAGGPVAAAQDADPRPDLKTARSAAPGPAAPVVTNAGADPGKMQTPFLPHRAPIAQLPAPARTETGASKPPPGPAKEAPSRPAERASGMPPRAPMHGESAAIPVLPGIQAAVAAGIQGMIAAALPLAPPAARQDSTSSSAGAPPDRFSSRLASPFDGLGSRQPETAGSHPDQVSGTPGTAGAIREAPPGHGLAVQRTEAGSRSAPDSLTGADAIQKAPPGSGAAAVSAKDEGTGLRNGAAPPASGTTSGSPVSAPPNLPRAIAVAAAGGKPLPPAADITPAAKRALGRESVSLIAGQVASAASALPAAAAGTAVKPADSATATNAPSQSLTGQLSGPIIAAAAGGHRDLALRLHPPELGDVSVRLVVTGRAVSAWFEAPQPQAQQAISQSMGELHAALAAAGWDLSGAWVGGEAWTPRERGGSPFAPRPVRHAAGGAPVQEAGGALPAGAGVSIYV